MVIKFLDIVVSSGRFTTQHIKFSDLHQKQPKFNTEMGLSCKLVKNVISILADTARIGKEDFSWFINSLGH